MVSVVISLPLFYISFKPIFNWRRVNTKTFTLMALDKGFLLYAHAWYTQKKYIYAKKIKRKKNQNVFKYGCKRVYRRCGSYRMYLEGDNPHQAVMIICELNWFFHISNRHNMRHLCTLAMFSHNTQILYYFDTCVGTMWFGHHKGYMC